MELMGDVETPSGDDVGERGLPCGRWLLSLMDIVFIEVEAIESGNFVGFATMA